MSRGQTARLRLWSLCGTGTLRGPVCRVPASSRQTCTGPVHMDALLAGSRELGPDEYRRKLNHVRNFETCTGSFVKTLIAQLIYLMLCGIRLISHGTRQGRVCIFRYTWAGSCHGWNSYGTRRPRVCGIPRVSAPRVPAGRDLRTHEGRVCGPPANSGQACTAGAPPGTRPARVSCNRANSAQVCTDTQRRPYSWGPSLCRPCKLGPGVYRRRAPRHMWEPMLLAVSSTSPSHGRKTLARFRSA